MGDLLSPLLFSTDCRISTQKKHSLSLQIEKSMRKEQNLGGARATVQTKTLKLSRSILTGTGQGNTESLSPGPQCRAGPGPGQAAADPAGQVRGEGGAARCEIRCTSCEGVPSRAALWCDPYLLPLTLPACLNKSKSGVSMRFRSSAPGILAFCRKGTQSGALHCLPPE